MKKYALLIIFCMLASMSGTYAQAQTSSSTGDQKIYKNVNDKNYASTPVWVLTHASGEYEITCESDEGSYFAGCSYNCKFYI